MTKFFATLFAVAALTITSACGGGSDRPTASEISSSLQGTGSLLGAIPVEADAADCLADVLASSDLPDESLRALVDADQDYEGAEEELDILQELLPEISACTDQS
jgi:hypothetical protein